MTKSLLSVTSISRRLATGNVETLSFTEGVSVLVGRPNTGKTKWLQLLDYLLGDNGENPFGSAEEDGLSKKYEAASATLKIGDQSFLIERAWRAPGAKTKIIVEGESMTAQAFQHWLLEKLGIPLLNFPKGNPMSGQTWPELSFRMLLRHIYRQQRFWGGLADQQPEAEQHAVIMQFLGLAERVFTDDYGELVTRKLDVERLKSRREQYNETLESLAREIIAEPGLTVSVNTLSLAAANDRLTVEIARLQRERIIMLNEGRDRAVPPDRRGHIAQLGERRASAVVKLEEDRRRIESVAERLADVKRYRSELVEELGRLSRAEDAGTILSDLKVTHCPACDQPVNAMSSSSGECFLCHQHLPGTTPEQLGAVRLQFESDRLKGELKEADELVEVLARDLDKARSEASASEDKLQRIEVELAPARQAVAALVQDEVSAIDTALGEANERRRQLARVAGALELEADLSSRIAALEKEIEPLQNRVNEVVRATDFDTSATALEDGMNAYLNAINAIRPNVWRHSPIRVDVSRSSFAIRVGTKHWHTALGGTDTLYFLMAYHYGLLSLSNHQGRHYPGLAIIDVPGEFSGEAVEDKENFIVQPFVELLRKDGFMGAQLLITGASFTNLEGVHFERLTHVHAA